MNNITFKRSIKKRKLLLTLLVMINLFISGNVFAIAKWNKRFVQCTWKRPKQNCITISAIVYDYTFGPRSEHGYLEHCKFEASSSGEVYFQLMVINTQRQKMSHFTTIYFTNKLYKAKIQFLNNCDNAVTYWPDAPNSQIEVTVRNKKENIAIVSLEWDVEESVYKEVRYIRISGIWHIDPPYPGNPIREEVYKIKLPDKSILKSNTLSLNTKNSESDTVKVFNESEAIVIKGADLGANIKVYTTSGIEINSVISNNDVVKIKLPAKQIYFVRIGISRYKVAL